MEARAFLERANAVINQHIARVFLVLVLVAVIVIYVLAMGLFPPRGVMEAIALPSDKFIDHGLWRVITIYKEKEGEVIIDVGTAMDLSGYVRRLFPEDPKVGDGDPRYIEFSGKVDRVTILPEMLAGRNQEFTLPGPGETEYLVRFQLRSVEGTTADTLKRTVTIVAKGGSMK